MSVSVLILGAGLGGLVCGRLLSRKGYAVTILEASDRPGGLLRPYLWDGVPCEQGFHSVGGLGPGEPLEILFRKLDLMDLPWYRADADEGFPFLRLNSRSDFELDHVLKPYQKSVWRLRGGGSVLSNTLARDLDIRYGAQVTSIENRTVTCEDGRTFTADLVVSDLSPKTTFGLLKDHVRPSYKLRLKKLKDGQDFFIVHCLLEPGCVQWQSGAIFLDDTLMLHFGEPDTHILDLICFGEGQPQEMIRRASVRLQGLQLQKYCTQKAPGYGILKYSNADFLPPQTPVPWLFLTGQEIGLHGILGTTVSAFNTSKAITL